LYDARSDLNATKPAEVLQEFFVCDFRARVTVRVCRTGVYACPFAVRPV